MDRVSQQPVLRHGRPQHPGRLWLALLAGVLLLNGCGGAGTGGPSAGGPGGHGGPRMESGGMMPRRALGEGGSMEGPKIALAQELIDAKTNPFLIKLPKINTVFQPGDNGNNTATATATPAVDPFAGVGLVGIIFNPKKSSILLSADGSTQVVSNGQVFTSGASQLKVTKVTPESVELEAVGNSGQKSTLTLPDIVNFHSTASAGESESRNMGKSSGDGGGQPPGKSIVDKLNNVIDGTGPANAPRKPGLNLQE